MNCLLFISGPAFKIVKLSLYEKETTFLVKINFHFFQFGTVKQTFLYYDYNCNKKNSIAKNVTVM
jgi:hypothetical protein